MYSLITCVQSRRVTLHVSAMLSEQAYAFFLGATENSRTENAAPLKMQGWKTRDWKTRHQCV